MVVLCISRYLGAATPVIRYYPSVGNLRNMLVAAGAGVGDVTVKTTCFSRRLLAPFQLASRPSPSSLLREPSLAHIRVVLAVR